ncbi:MAG: hypothetical protein AVDCRST_MAG08-1017, partial [uncultured Acetobacteraceae bacterium]
ERIDPFPRTRLVQHRPRGGGAARRAPLGRVAGHGAPDAPVPPLRLAGNPGGLRHPVPPDLAGAALGAGRRRRARPRRARQRPAGRQPEADRGGHRHGRGRRGHRARHPVRLPVAGARSAAPPHLDGSPFPHRRRGL